MQGDKSKLYEAESRRNWGRRLLILGFIFLVPYVFFIVSEGEVDFLSLGHYSVFIFVSLGVSAFVVMKPIYELESPFLYSLDQKRKPGK